MVGRQAELAAIASLFEDVDAGPAMLVLAGEAGIGKTTVWRAAVDAAKQRGFVVLATQPTAAEVRLSYVGLADLLAEADSQWFLTLPPPQRRALDAALLRGPGDDPAPDPRAVAAGFLTLLAGLAADRPVLVAIDDLPWLDESSRRVVEFAIRRSVGPVAVLAARRDDPAEPPTSSGDPTDQANRRELGQDLRPRDPGRARTLPIGPLSLAALHHVIGQRTGDRLSRPALVRLWEACGGNPFFALEMVRGTDAELQAVPHLPDSLRGLIGHRLTQLDGPVGDALLVAAALAAPRLEQVARALEADDADQLLAIAEDRGVVKLSTNGSVAFTHPLLASGVYSSAPHSVRRDLHGRLARVVVDPEERARHLALAALGPDPDTIQALDAAADHARRRGAPATAAELLELAMGLGVGGPARRIQAAHDHFHAGHPTRAWELVEATIGDLPDGVPRAEALALLGTIRFDLDTDDRAADLLEQALDEATSDPPLRCSIAMLLGYVRFNSGRPDDALPCVITAVEAAEQAGDDGLLAEALAAYVVVRFLLGEGADETMLARALELEDPDRNTRANAWPTTAAALVYGWSRRFDEALAAFAIAHQRCLDQGAESELWFVAFWAVPTACAAGDLETATRHVDELVDHAQLVGGRQGRALARTSLAQLSAWVGRIDDARVAGTEAMGLFGDETPSPFALLPAAAVGMAELSVGAHEAAAAWLVPAVEAQQATLREPAVLPIQPDAIEALLALDRLDAAEPLVDHLEADGRRRGRLWAAAVGARCRALLLTAQGRAEDADAVFAQAVAAHDRLPQGRYDRARTLLAYGRHQRRRNQRRGARASLQEAARLFDAVGCRQWARKAGDELDRLGLQPRAGDQLTPTEQHVAELAASGMTVREVAGALYVSPKTIEAHLTRIYRKLGIHSRAELGRHMAEQAKATEPT